MNNICYASEFLVFIMYSDDTYMQMSGNDITYLVGSLNVELELLSRWLNTNKLYILPQILSFYFFTEKKLKIMTSVFKSMNLL